MKERVSVLVGSVRPAVRRSLTEVLEDEGYHVMQAEDAADLMDELSSAEDDGTAPTFAAVVCDATFGLEVLEELRESDFELPFVLLGEDDPDERREAEALAAVVVADFDVDELLAALEELLDESHAQAA